MTVSRSKTSIPVIDLFAGPGGLNHGFSSYSHKKIRFDVRLSIEMDESAHKTLTLRAFLGQFSMPPKEYYQYIRKEKGMTREELSRLFPKEWAVAENEAKQWKLGEKPFAEVSEAISKALQGNKDWVLIGGPPCQAYSLMGRARMKNDVNFAKDHRHKLYLEYLKIVAVHQPKVFVMENVKGILSSKHGVRDSNSGSIFFQILQDLRNPADTVVSEADTAPLLPKQRYRYRIYSFVNRALVPDGLEPADFLIRSEEWGIPQKRHRVILLGIREDVTDEPKILRELFEKESVCTGEVISDLPKLRSRISKKKDHVPDSPENWVKSIEFLKSRKVMSEVSNREVQDAVKDNLSRLTAPEETGKHYFKGTYRPQKLVNWFFDENLRGIIQHEAKSHMPLDLARYFFVACYALRTGKSPKLGDFPEALLPEHRNAKRLNEEKEQKKQDFADRFRVQVRNTPSTTVMSHISKDGHYYIHYDPLQCRSLTVREAARLQTFPDSYFFEGGITEQYHQVGNAVPPLLAYKLATVVADLLLVSAERIPFSSRPVRAVIASESVSEA